MSWEVFVVRMPSDVADIGALPQDFRPPPLAPAQVVRERIRTAVPEVDWSAPVRGELEGASWSMALNLGDEGPVDSLMLRVHGGGGSRELIGVVGAIAAALESDAIDISTGERVTEEGWAAWQDYRDRAIAARVSEPAAPRRGLLARFLRRGAQR